MCKDVEHKKKSIYKEFVDNINKSNKLPYEFQNIYVDGKKDVLFELWGEETMYEERAVYSKALIILIQDIIDEKQSYNEISYFLEECAIYFYYDIFLKKLKVYYLEEILDKERLYSLAIYLTTESKNINEVKLGIIILGLYENDITRQIIKTLGFHSEFTLYAIEATKEFRCCNSIILEFFRGTEGYGKLIAMQRLIPLSKDIEKDIIEIGYKNKAIPHISAIFSLEKGNLYKYIASQMTEKKFVVVSNIIAYAFDDVDFKDFKKSAKIVEKYIEYAKSYNKDFLDLIALINIHRGVNSKFKNDKESDNGWSKEFKEKLCNECNKILLSEKWKHIVLNELDKLRYSSSMIVKALQTLKMKPVFEEFYYILSLDNFDLDLFEYMLFECGDYYIVDMMNYIRYVAPWEKILSYMLSEDKADIDKKYKPDIILEFLLSRMRECNINNEEFFVKCLRARLPKCRCEAVKCLGKFKSSWSEEVSIKLEKLYDDEISGDVKKILARILNKDRNLDYKKERIINGKYNKIIHNDGDIKLAECSVAGAYYNNLEYSDELKINNILYLKIENENIYDKKTVLITDFNGYVLGYVPKKFNEIIFNMLQAQETIYALIKDINLEKSNILIDLCYSKKRNISNKPNLIKL